MATAEEVVESYLNGNIGVFKNWLNLANKNEVLSVVEILMECGEEDPIGTVRRYLDG